MSFCNPADTNLMRSMFTCVGVDEANTSARNAASAARSPACYANTSERTRTSGRTTACTVTSPLRLKVWTGPPCLLVSLCTCGGIYFFLLPATCLDVGRATNCCWSVCGSSGYLTSLKLRQRDSSLCIQPFCPHHTA